MSIQKNDSGALTAGQILQYIESLGGGALSEWHKKQVEEKYESFVLIEIDIADINREHGLLVSSNKFDRYAAIASSSQPAIVLVKESWGIDILDGAHRFEASLIRQDQMIQAYLGKRKAF